MEMIYKLHSMKSVCLEESLDVLSYNITCKIPMEEEHSVQIQTWKVEKVKDEVYLLALPPGNLACTERT